MFNLAIDSKLRGCDVAALRVEVMALGACAIDRAGSIESTVRYLGSEVDDALAIAEQVDV